MADTMQAVVISRFGGPEVLERRTVPKPSPALGEVLIHVHAFGLNHAEMHMRKGEWDQWNPITGLECVGVVEACPDNKIAVGSQVAGVMGGLGRTRPGGYGEYVTVPGTNVIPIKTDLPWEQLAALPEVYCTAYSTLFTILDIKKHETLLIRGATSTIGQAALNLAVDLGALVTATTRRRERIDMLKNMGAKDVIIEKQNLTSQLDASIRFDKVLNLVGNSVLVESISLTKAGGRICQAGWLGGLAPVKDFNPMIEMQSGVHFSLFHSKELGGPDFPLSGIPFQEIVDKIAKGAWDAKPTRAFSYNDIVEAHRILDSHDAGGKIVIKH